MVILGIMTILTVPEVPKETRIVKHLKGLTCSKTDMLYEVEDMT